MSVNVKQNGALTKVGGLYKESTPMSVAEYYSTDEHKVGVNTDGKPLYQKTYIWQGEIAPNGYTVLDANLLSTSVDDFLLVNAEYRASSTTGGALLANIYTNSMGGKIAEVSINTANGLYIENMTSLYIRQAKVTVQYTKTTDNATGGVYAPIIPMQMASKYSTDEKVVGQWTDGKPLYQRTVTATSNVATQDGSWADISNAMSPTISNAEKLVDAQLHGTVNIDYSQLRFTVDSGVIKCASKVSGNGWYTGLLVTFFYTKTTDTANTGLYSDDEATLGMLGDVDLENLADGDIIKYNGTSGKFENVPKEVYSTTEQVIGTWVDGKPLYRRKLPTVTMASSGGYTYTHNIGIKYYINIGGTCTVNNQPTRPQAFPFFQSRWSSYCNVQNTEENEIIFDSTWNNNTIDCYIEYTKVADYPS